MRFIDGMSDLWHRRSNCVAGSVPGSTEESGRIPERVIPSVSANDHTPNFADAKPLRRVSARTPS